MISKSRLLVGSVAAAFATVLGSGWVLAGPPKGGGGFGGGRPAGMPSFSQAAKPASGMQMLSKPATSALGGVANKGPISIPKNSMANGGSSSTSPDGKGKGKGKDNGQGNSDKQAIASQLLQSLISQIGSGGGGGDSGGGGGGGGDSGGGYDPGPAPAPTPVAAAEPPPPATGTNTALQITDLDRGPAARAGMQKGDIILKVDGTRTRTFEDLQATLAASSGTSRVLFFNPEEGKLETKELPVANGRIGVAVVPVPVDFDDSKSTPPAPAEQTALRVTEVRPGSAAAAGIQTGDVIVGVDGKRVSTGEELVALLKTSKGTSDIAVYIPEKGKLETKSMKVGDGSIGLSVKVVPIEVQ